MKKLTAVDEYGYKVHLTRDGGLWVNHDGSAICGTEIN